MRERVNKERGEYECERQCEGDERERGKTEERVRKREGRQRRG